MATEKINYIELPATDIAGTRRFFARAFGWEFIDYGPEYAAIANAGIDGGFYKSGLRATTDTGSALIDFFARELGGFFYNRGLYDAETLITEKVSEISDQLLQLEKPVSIG